VGGIVSFGLAQVPSEVAKKDSGDSPNWIYEERVVPFDPYKQWLVRGSVGTFNAEQEWAHYLLNKGGKAGDRDLFESIGSAMQQAKNDNDDVLLVKLNASLEKAVAEQFDAIQSQREKELDRLEKTLATLRSMHGKRLSQREQIIAEKVAQVKRDVAGLGWISPSPKELLKDATQSSGQQRSSQGFGDSKFVPREILNQGQR
jgi:hypothetical protein